jgi:hypothetical protein
MAEIMIRSNAIIFGLMKQFASSVRLTSPRLPLSVVPAPMARWNPCREGLSMKGILCYWLKRPYV